MLGYTKRLPTRTSIAAVGAALAAMASTPALAGGGGPTIPSIDLGLDAGDIASQLSSVVLPFLLAAIGVGFAFFAVKYGAKLIKSWIRG